MLADALGAGGDGPSSTLENWQSLEKLRENWYLILFVDLIVCFPFSC